MEFGARFGGGCPCPGGGGAYRKSDHSAQKKSAVYHGVPLRRCDKKLPLKWFITSKASGLEVESGKWKVESGKWKVESGKWEVGSGKWEVESGKWKVESG